MARRTKATIRYDGPALAEHEMDVHRLAPALLGLGDLCRVANHALNSDAASVKVLVRADVEQKCFQLEFELVQSLYERLTTVLEQDQVQDAKDILEWIGILAGGTAGAGATLFGLYRFLSRKQPKDTISVSNADANGNVTYQIVGDGNSLIVPGPVDQIARDPRALSSFKRMLEPLQHAGYETVEFEHFETRAALFTREEAKQIIALSEDELIVERDGELVSLIKTSVKVRKAVFEGDSVWGINYKRAVDAKMLDTEWLEDFQAGRIPLPPKSRLVVDLRETVPVDEDRMEQGAARYEIVKVYGVELPPEQYDLLKE
ncbi:MAG: hypothetical protein AAGA72_18720 [Pseudomonadota bacterium]